MITVQTPSTTPVGCDADFSIYGGAATTYAALTTAGDSKGVELSTPAATGAHEFLFNGFTMPTGHMIAAVKIVAVAKGTGADLRFTVRRGDASTDDIHWLPRATSWNLTGSFAEYSITLVNRPCTDSNSISHSSAWTEDTINDHVFGFRCDTNPSGTIQVDQFRLDVITRPAVTLDELLASDKCQTFWGLEIEGIRWVPTTQTLNADDWTVGAYYWGVDYRPVAGTMFAPSALRSGRTSLSKGREEGETAKFTLVDVNQVAFERDANTGDPVNNIYSNGFYTWLFSDQQSWIARRRLISSTGDGWNSFEGLDPLWSSGGNDYGRRLKTDSSFGLVLTGLAEDNNYIYVGKETIFWHTWQSDGYGDETSATDLRRGQFGSMNSLHEYNRITGIYPEVANHPISWAGRYVRLWLNAIDPATGLPLPLSCAKGRTFLWATHQFDSGRSEHSWSISCAPADDLLKAPIMRTRDASLFGISLPRKQYFSEFLAGLGYQEADFTINVNFATTLNAVDNGPYPIAPTRLNYLSLQDLVDDLNDQAGIVAAAAAAPQRLIIGFAVVAETQGVAITVVAAEDDGGYKGRKAYIDFLGATDAIGFEPGSRLEQADNYEAWSSFDADVQAVSVQVFASKTKACGAYASARSTSLQFYGASTVEWNNLALNYNDTSRRMRTYISCVADGGSDNRVGFAPNAAAITAATSGTVEYATLDVKPDRESDNVMFRYGVATGKELASVTQKIGDPPRQVSLILITQDTPLADLWPALIASTGFGTNGSDDVLPYGFGAGINSNIFAADTSRKVLTAAPWCLRSYVFHKPDSVESYLNEEIMFPNGVQWRQDEQGRLTFDTGILPQWGDTTVTVIDDDDMTNDSNASLAMASREIVNVIKCDIDLVPFADRSLTTIEAREPNSIELFGQKSLTMKHRGIRTRNFAAAAAGQGATLSMFWLMASTVFHKWAMGAPIVTCEIGAAGLALTPGQSVRFTSSILPSPDGTGFDDVGGIVLSVNKDDIAAKAGVEIYLDSQNTKPGGFAPAAMISSYTTGSYTCYTHAFSDATDDIDTAAFAVGDVLYLIEANDNSPSAEYITISAISSNVITATAAVGFTPEDGDLLVWANYDQATATQVAQSYVYTARANGTIDAGQVVDGFDWVI